MCLPWADLSEHALKLLAWPAYVSIRQHTLYLYTHILPIYVYMYASGGSFRACVEACVSATNLLAFLVQKYKYWRRLAALSENALKLASLLLVCVSICTFVLAKRVKYLFCWSLRMQRQGGYEVWFCKCIGVRGLVYRQVPDCPCKSLWGLAV